jgi:2'-5' RNA ligase
MRLFVAVDLPDPVKAALIALQTEIPTARWTTWEQMHLTLFFIGETTQTDAVKQALAAVEGMPFTVTLNGVGRLPPQQRQPPRVLWTGIENQPALLRLQQRVTAALTPLGFEADGRPFSPHITLARLKTEKPLPAVDAFLKAYSQFKTAAIPIREFVLFSSTLTPQGARYRREAVYALDHA